MYTIRTLYNALSKKEKSVVRRQMESFFHVKERRIDRILLQPDGQYKVDEYLFMVGLVSQKIPTEVQRFAKHIGKECLVQRKTRYKTPIQVNADQVAFATN